MARQVDAFLSFYGAEFFVVTAYATLTEPTGRAPRRAPRKYGTGRWLCWKAQKAEGNLTFLSATG
jgi:hypothetical protein